MTAPIRYTPDIERPEPDEADTIRGLEEQFDTIQKTTSADYGHAVRGVHAKGHGIAHGTLTVAFDLQPELSQGLFAHPGTYEAILRISTNPGDLLDDSVGLPRGLALKVLDVPGERLPGSEAETNQDFVLVNGPAFAAKTPKQFLSNLKLLAKTTDKGEGVKKALSAVLHAVESVVETVGGESATLKQLGGAPQVHPLGETYWSQTAFRFGDHVAKFRLKPVSAALTRVTGDTIDTHGRPDAIREAVRETLIEAGGAWELQVQLCTDLAAMPVEDPTVVWDEAASPFRTVATLEVPPQLSWENGRSEHSEDKLAFGPWHGLAAFQPLGGVNRARKDPYVHSAGFRARFNGCPLHQPKTLAELR